MNMSSMASLLQSLVQGTDDKPVGRKRRYSCSDSESQPDDSKRRREDDELSLSPSDGDINEFLKESAPREVEVPSTAAEPEEELEILKSLEADFTDDGNVETKINERLANIASKRWGLLSPTIS